tara:strand:+ start:823 stop:3690 length:2868 start_codon:yes stop_codon:yes gene_type:complete
VANYNVDILLKIGGTAALKQLNDKLKETEKLQKKIEQLSAGASSANYLRNKLTAEKQFAEFKKKTLAENKRLEASEQRLFEIVQKRARAEQTFGQEANRIARQKTAEKIRELRLERQLQNERLKGLGQYGSPIGPNASGAAEFRKFNQRMAQERAMQAYMGAGAPGAPASGRPFGGGQKALPAFQQRGLKLLDDSVRLNQRNLEIETRLNGQRARGVRFLEKQTQEEKRQLDLGIGGRQRTNQLPGGGMGRGRFGMASQYGQPIGPQRPRRGGAFRSSGAQSALLGAGFPLLFGGGAGSIAGGLLGSGGGFGGQIFGSAIGQQVDQFASKLVGLAGALDGTGGSTEALETLLGDLDSETARRIQNLEESGQASLAADAAFQKLSDEIGDDLAKAAVLAGQDLNALGNQVTKFFTILGVSIASLFQEALFLNTRDPLEGVPEVSLETAVERATSGEAVEVARVQLELAEAKKLKNQEAAFAAEQELIDLRKANDLGEITRQIQDDSLDGKIGENKQREIELRARREAADLAERTAAADERSAREAERAAAKAKREADAAFRKRQQELKKLRQGEAALKGAQVQSLEADLQFVKTFSDRELAIRSERASIQGILDLKIDQLRLTTEDNKLLLVKEHILVRQADTKDRILERELFALRVSERRLKIEKAIERQSGLTSIDRQIESISIGKGPGSEEQLLALDQRIRREDALIEARQKLAVINDKILELDPTSTDEEYNKLVRERTEQEAYNVSLQGRLDLLDQAEQAQLRFNQALEAAKPFADAFTSGLLDGMVAVVDGTKTAEQAFADFLNSIAKMLMQTAQQMIAQYIALGIARMFAGVPAASSGTDTSFMGGGFNPLNFVAGPFSGYGTRALGGSVSGNQPYLVGERGPELFVPGAQGNIVPNSAMGSANVTVNVDASGSSVEGDSEQAGQLGKMLGAAVQAELIKQKRPGGLLA